MRLLVSIILAWAGIASALGGNIVRLDASAASGDSVFNDVAAAIAEVNRLALQGKVTLMIAPGVYWLDNPDDPTVKEDPAGGIPYAVTIECDTLEIIGTDPDPVNTVFACNRGQTQGAIGNFTMIHFKGRSLEVHNMTMGNYCNVDLVYPRDPSLNRERRGKAIVQAQVGICDGTDRLYSSNCRYISRLNLCPMIGARRSFYKDCHFESTDDALTGSGVYQGCHFTFFSSKPFYNAPATGAVMLDCDIDVMTCGEQYLTKVPSQMALIDTRFHSRGATPPSHIRWSREAGAAVGYQSGVTLDGVPLIIDQDRPWMTVDLTGLDGLQAYRVVTPAGEVIYNIPSLLGGDDGWDPLNLSARIVEVTGDRQALDLPVALLFEPENISLGAVGDTVIITPRAVRWGGYASKKFISSLNWQFPNALTLENVGNYHAKRVTSSNRVDRHVKGNIRATSPDGLCGTVATIVAPYLTEAPSFAAPTRVVYDKKLKALRADYDLTRGETDCSHIVWYRYTRDDLSDTIPVVHGSAGSMRVYPLTRADVGYRLMARVTPRVDGAAYGEPADGELPMEVTTSMIAKGEKIESLTTDFSHVPVHHQPTLRPGCWSFDAYKPTDTQRYEWNIDNSRPAWFYGNATDGATGTGLVQWQRGARMFYTPLAAAASNHTLMLDLQPCKSAGQGFGSATGQYMDIYIAFDPATLSGHALRIERTPEYDHAVIFTLVEYRNGVVTPLSQPVASSCYRTTCHVELTLADGTLTAIATTDSPVADAANADGVVPSVLLTAPATPRGTVIGVQHTGTTGASATLISRLDASWQ